MRATQFVTEAAEKPLTQCTDQALQKLLGKGKLGAMIKHPWFQEYRNYTHAYKHGVSKAGFTNVEVYSYFPGVNVTAEGKIRPLIMVEFTFSYSGTKVIQAYKYYRDKEPNDNEKRMGPQAGWKHFKTWKEEDDLVNKAWDKHNAVNETINPDILDPQFSDEQEIGDYRYTAHMQVAGFSKVPQLIVRCFDGKTKIGEVQFYSNYGESLVSALTSVDPLYQRQGIASTMYAYARMLGNTIEPSSHQLRPGKNMWRAWKKRGDDKHLVAENYRQVKYDFHREPDNWFVATADGAEIGRFQGKSQWDSGAAQEAAKKCINMHRADAANKKNAEDQHRFQFEKPLSDTEKRWVLTYHRLFIEQEQGTQKEYDNLTRWAEVVRKSIGQVQSPMDHPLVKEFMKSL